MEAGPSKRKLVDCDVEKSSKLPKKSDEDEWKSFPRCEYKVRFKGTSAFRMVHSKFWGTYYRSTKQGGNYDRLNTIPDESEIPDDMEIARTPKIVPQKRTIRRASSGIFRSPYARRPYAHQYNLRSTKANTDTNNNSSDSDINGAADKNGEFLYDKLLKYKCKLCKIVVEKFSIFGPKRMDVYVQNDFPCVIVQVHTLKNTVGEKKLYEICVAYFCAIANYFATKNNVPIEMVIRASIGHNIPSVSATSSGFRINIGIVPEVYATSVLFESLMIFNKQLDQMFREKLNLDNSVIDGLNNDINSYNTIKSAKSNKPIHLENWDSSETILDVLCKKGDSRGNTVALQITRLNHYIDLLCDYVHAEIMENPQELLLTAEALRKMLNKFRINNNRVTVDVQNVDFIPIAHFEFSKEENPGIKNDAEFWAILKQLCSALNQCDIDETRKTHGLYAMLEKANKKFISDCSQQCEEGYGSDSDGESCISGKSKAKISHFFTAKNDSAKSSGDIKCFHKKVIVQTGMRAINLAYALAKCLTETKTASTKHMYYETRDAIRNATDEISIENLNFVKSQKQKLTRFVDLNFCANTKSNRSKVNLDDIHKISKDNDERVIIFDYTSATSDKINKAIRFFIPHVKVILLVNSGSKNEQIGADNNPYGTLRIVTTDVDILNQLYCGLIDALDSKAEKLPADLHNIRKAYKAIGAVITSKTIFKDNWTPKHAAINPRS